MGSTTPNNKQSKKLRPGITCWAIVLVISCSALTLLRDAVDYGSFSSTTASTSTHLQTDSSVNATTNNNGCPRGYEAFILPYSDNNTSDSSPTPNRPCGKVFPIADFFRQSDSVLYKNATGPSMGWNYVVGDIGLHHLVVNRSHVVFNALMKCASSTISDAMKDRAKTNDDDDGVQLVGSNLGRNESRVTIEHITKWQQATRTASVHNEETYQYMSILRDPVSRFVSATAQEMFAHNTRDTKAIDFRAQCLYNTSATNTLQCALKYVQACFSGEKRLIRPHFIPMATTLLRRAYGTNVSIVLFEMRHVDALSRAILPRAERKNVHGTVKAQGSDVLSQMSTNDLTLGMVRQICELYRMDVLLLEHLGFDDLLKSCRFVT